MYHHTQPSAEELSKCVHGALARHRPAGVHRLAALPTATCQMNAATSEMSASSLGALTQPPHAKPESLIIFQNNPECPYHNQPASRGSGVFKSSCQNRSPPLSPRRSTCRCNSTYCHKCRISIAEFSPQGGIATRVESRRSAAGRPTCNNIRRITLCY